jgi:predicted dehydrogenase
MNLGIVGGGSWFEAMHAPAIRSQKGINRIVLSCLDEKRAKALCRKWGYDKYYLDFREMAKREKLDAVCIVTPPVVAPAIIALFLKQGVPVFTEKPPAADLKSMASLLKIRGAPCFVAFNRRHIKPVLEARKWIQAQPKITHVSVDFLRHDTIAPGHLMASAIHSIDALRFLFGEAEEVRALSGSVKFFDRKAVSYGGLIRFKSGVLAVLNYNCRSGLVRERYSVFAEDKTLVMDLTDKSGSFDNKKIRIYENLKKVLEKSYCKGSPSDINGITAEHACFLSCVRKKNAMSPDLEDAARTMVLAETVNRGLTL